MLEDLKKDYEIHGKDLKNRAFWALAVFRLGKWTLKRRNPIWRWFSSKGYGVLRLISEILTGISIDPKMIVGEGFHIIHAEGPISFHPNVIIGKRCGIMHNVTIGTNMDKGVPRIGDDVFIGVGACILGDIRIGNRVSIAANTLVNIDIPDDSIAIGVPARIYPKLKPLV